MPSPLATLPLLVLGETTFLAPHPQSFSGKASFLFPLQASLLAGRWSVGSARLVTAALDDSAQGSGRHTAWQLQVYAAAPIFSLRPDLHTFLLKPPTGRSRSPGLERKRGEEVTGTGQRDVHPEQAALFFNILILILNLFNT